MCYFWWFKKNDFFLSRRSCFPTLSPFWKSILSFFPLWMPVCSLNPKHTILLDMCSSNLWVHEIALEIIFELLLFWLAIDLLWFWGFLVLHAFKTCVPIHPSVWSFPVSLICMRTVYLHSLKILSALRLPDLPVVFLTSGWMCNLPDTWPVVQ